ncbi:hypothetical protein SAMN02745866_04091 [Alteromonadaceae bacterium Bs31]|nr:hypothetical protein SAMN02745866_04091 [Alteromonadaceae bacterium Bs31]
MPKIEIRYIPEVSEDEEEVSEVLFEYEFEGEEFSECLTMPHRDLVLPNGEIINIVGEITLFGNTFTARENSERITSIKASGGFVLMFSTRAC